MRVRHTISLEPAEVGAAIRLAAAQKFQELQVPPDARVVIFDDKHSAEVEWSDGEDGSE